MARGNIGRTRDLLSVVGVYAGLDMNTVGPVGSLHPGVRAPSRIDAAYLRILPDGERRGANLLLRRAFV